MTEVVVAPESLDGPARKRRKASPPEAAGEEEEKKRSRGRPRLEPKDETAQDVSRPYICYFVQQFTQAPPIMCNLNHVDVSCMDISNMSCASSYIYLPLCFCRRT